MELFKNSLKRRLSQKYLGNQAIGVLSIKAIQKYFSDKKIDGYAKFTTVFVVTQDSNLKMKVFRDKKNILLEINKFLERMGYDIKMKNIIVKFKDNSGNG